MPFGENVCRGVNNKKFRSTKPGKHEGFIPNPIGCNELLGRAVQDMLVQRLGHVNASFRSSTAEDLPKPTFSELMADVVSNSSIQQSKQNAFTLKTGPVKVHSVPLASEPRSC